MNRLYFAAPLFTQAERAWNAEVIRGLRAAGYEVFAPQEEAAPILAEFGLDASRIFQRMVEGLKGAAVVVAVVDGPDADSGTSWECGYAYALGKPVCIVRTDLRTGGDDAEAGVNLMLSRSAHVTVRHPADSVPSALAQEITQRIGSGSEA